jgi:hypothetical protein
MDDSNHSEKKAVYSNSEKFRRGIKRRKKESKKCNVSIY